MPLLSHSHDLSHVQCRASACTFNVSTRSVDESAGCAFQLIKHTVASWFGCFDSVFAFEAVIKCAGCREALVNYILPEHGPNGRIAEDAVLAREAPYWKAAKKERERRAEAAAAARAATEAAEAAAATGVALLQLSTSPCWLRTDGSLLGGGPTLRGHGPHIHCPDCESTCWLGLGRAFDGRSPERSVLSRHLGSLSACGERFFCSQCSQ